MKIRVMIVPLLYNTRCIPYMQAVLLFFRVVGAFLAMAVSA
jgi:hypothetical protein